MSGGLLLVFEGPEGSGKSTQARLLRDALQRREVACELHREPGGTALGERIRSLLLDPEADIVPEAEALLFMASRAELMRHVVRPALADDRVVILDRFFLSTYAYQVAGRMLPEYEVRVANSLAVGGLRPDLNVLLLIDPDAGLQRALRRGGPDRMESDGREFHVAVSQAFASYADAAWLEAHPECGPVVALDAAQSEQQVHELVIAEVDRRFGGRVGA